MLEGHDIICFANDWDGDPLSKKHIALRLAEKNRVLWVNSTGNRNPTASVRDLRRAWKKLRQGFGGCRTVAKNIYVFSPLVIPFHGNRAARWINRRVLHWSMRRTCRKLGFQNPITWTFVPSSADVAGSLGEQLVIYHCVDEYSKFTGTDKAGILEMERRLMEKADLVVVSSTRLYETKRRYNPNTFLVTHGVDVTHFRDACRQEIAAPADCADLHGPVIGFFGLIADWVDLEVVRYLAASRPRLVAPADRRDSGGHIGPARVAKRPPAGKTNLSISSRLLQGLRCRHSAVRCQRTHAGGQPSEIARVPGGGAAGGGDAAAGGSEAQWPGADGTDARGFLEQIETQLNEGKRGPDPAVSALMERESWDEKVEELSEIIARLNGDGRRLVRIPPAKRAA